MLFGKGKRRNHRDHITAHANRKDFSKKSANLRNSISDTNVLHSQAFSPSLIGITTFPVCSCFQAKVLVIIFEGGFQTRAAVFSKKLRMNDLSCFQVK